MPDTDYSFTPADIKRFWSKVRKTDGCWEWIGLVYPNGYGRVRVNGCERLAHRASYVLHKGVIASGKLVMHTCDNRVCVNPNHLVIGAHKDNAQDMVSKRRCRYGETHHKKALTQAQVSEIRLRYARNDVSQTALAHEYGVSYVTIHQIVTGKRWNLDEIPENERQKGKRFRPSVNQGEAQGLAKLTKEAVLDIRQRYVPYKVTLRQLAEEYGVNEVTIHYAVHGKSWKHI